MDKKDHNEKSDSNDTSISAIQLGVWRVLLQEESSWDIRKHWRDLSSTLPLSRRLATEIFYLDPWLFIFFVVSKVWTGIESALLLYLSSRLLTIIEISITRGQPDATAIFSAVAARLICVVVVAVMEWWGEKLLPTLRSRITCHFELFLMQARLQVDLPTSQENSTKSRISARDAWESFDEIVRFVTELIMMASQLAFIIQSSRSTGGPFFALLCVAKPIMCAVSSRSLWSKPHVVHPNNDHYLRMEALQSLTGDRYRQDVISGHIGNYLIEEYSKASKALGNASDEYPSSQYQRRATPNWDVLCDVFGDLPMVYCAVNAVLNPSKFSITSIAILQQSSSTLRWTLESVLQNTASFRRHLNEIRSLYDAAKVNNKVVDGERPYPNPIHKSDKGMSFDLRNVTFAYPGSKESVNALNDVSISIPAGQLVVVVGANGSGKSTIVKILSRLYDPSSGEIHVDGQPIQQYHLSDLRQATATLTQDHLIYPLSLSENIGLGHPDLASDVDLVVRASKLGGAYDCISKLADGFGTKLDTPSEAYGINLSSDSADPLQKELEKLQKVVDISGGERQRIVASRTFMRFNSGKVKFVAVDEPSSALDPEAEFQLFERLREARSGKTMVFVTHRFGHLTKHADLIICMKDGAIAESGTHEALISNDGEYSKLYNIQASAFIPPASE